MLLIDEKVVRTLTQVTREEWEAILVLARKMLEQLENDSSKEDVQEDGSPVQKVEEEPKETKSNIQEGPCNKEDLHIKVLDLLKEIGVPPHILGYMYLAEAITLVHEDKTYVQGITKRLYPEIARKFNSTSQRVERAIRHAIEFAFDKGNYEVHEKVFKGVYSPLKGRPTNNHAIAALAEYVKLYS